MEARFRQGQDGASGSYHCWAANSSLVKASRPHSTINTTRNIYRYTNSAREVIDLLARHIVGNREASRGLSDRPSSVASCYLQ